MSLVDKLMSVDKGILVNRETAEIKAKTLSKILGEDVTVKVKALEPDVYIGISTNILDKNGNTDYSKTYDLAALLCAEAMVEPSLKDKELQKHFGAATPKELAKMLFKGTELTDISSKITEISGFGRDAEEEEEVKN